MKFNWDEFTEIGFFNYCATMKDAIWYDEYVGCVRVGNLCFDLLIRFDDNKNKVFTYDLYAGGVDTGYGYSNPNKFNKELYKAEYDYPYDYVNGLDFANICTNMSYEDFKAYAEEEFERFIKVEDETYKEASLIDKANEPLRIW